MRDATGFGTARRMTVLFLGLVLVLIFGPITLLVG
jgi:hypothetical protein